MKYERFERSTRFQPDGRNEARERFERAFAAAGVIREATEDVEDGYLPVLDSNSTYFDYDTDVDERLLDLDFCTNRFSSGKATRRRPGSK